MFARETAVYICEHVFRGEPVLLVMHDNEGDWQCLCGGSHPTSDVPLVAGINHELDKDPTLREVLDLPDGWEAERESVGSPWIRTPMAADQ